MPNFHCHHWTWETIEDTKSKWATSTLQEVTGQTVLKNQKIWLSFIFNVSFPSVRHPEFSISTLVPVCAPRKPPVPAISFGHQQDAPVNAMWSKYPAPDPKWWTWIPVSEYTFVSVDSGIYWEQCTVALDWTNFHYPNFIYHATKKIHVFEPEFTTTKNLNIWRKNPKKNFSPHFRFFCFCL